MKNLRPQIRSVKLITPRLFKEVRRQRIKVALDTARVLGESRALRQRFTDILEQARDTEIDFRPTQRP